MRPFNWVAERTTAPLLRRLGIPTYWGELWTPIIPFLIPILVWSIIGFAIITVCVLFAWIGEKAEDIWVNEP